MDIFFFITLFVLCGLCAMILYRGWELSRGTVVHAHPHAIKHGIEATKIYMLRMREKGVELWFEHVAPPLARLWIKGAKALKWSILRANVMRLYGRVRGHVAPVGGDATTSPEEPSQFLQHVQEHKEKTAVRKKRAAKTKQAKQVLEPLATHDMIDASPSQEAGDDDVQESNDEDTVG